MLSLIILPCFPNEKEYVSVCVVIRIIFVLLSATEKLTLASLFISFLKSTCAHQKLPLWGMVNLGSSFVPGDPAPEENQADSFSQEFGI